MLDVGYKACWWGRDG